eukprot:6264099-Prymnesium_polylepis.3
MPRASGNEYGRRTVSISPVSPRSLPLSRLGIVAVLNMRPKMTPISGEKAMTANAGQTIRKVSSPAKPPAP